MRFKKAGCGSGGRDSLAKMGSKGASRSGKVFGVSKAIPKLLDHKDLPEAASGYERYARSGTNCSILNSSSIQPYLS